MTRTLYVYDPREKWIDPAVQAAKSRGWQATAVNADWAPQPGYMLFLPHAHPQILAQDQLRAEQWGAGSIHAAGRLFQGVRWITDRSQIDCYEYKRAQVARWKRFMPETWVPWSLENALEVLAGCTYPLVSKADVGASSVNVRILKDRKAAERHIRELWGKGVRVEHCDSQGSHSVQQGYAILQEFIPHTVTWRVNCIGRQRAVFKRFCYPDRPVAQTGNVEPAYTRDELPPGLLDFADEVFSAIGSKWCALDILRDEARQQWRLLETSLRWPWPSPGDCMNAVFFPSGRKWADLFDVLIDELEAEVFDAP